MCRSTILPRVVLVCSALTVGHSLWAQSSGLGLKGGAQVNLSRASGQVTQPTYGALIGLYGTIYAARSVEVQPELLANMQSRVLHSGERGLAGVRFYYAQVPLSFKYYFGNTFNLAAGPQAGMLLAAQQFGDTTINISERVSNWDFGLNAGVGADLTNGWDFTLRYYSGISSVFKDPDVLFPVHRNAQLTVGYRIAQWRHKTTRGRSRL